jgi:hypothetical protein
VFAKLGLPSRLFGAAAVALAVAVALTIATATGAQAAQRGSGSLRVAASPHASCIPALSSAPVIPRQTIASLTLRGGLAVKLRSAHPATWVLTVMVSAQVGRTLGNSGQHSTLPIGSATERFPKPGRAMIRVPLDGAVLPVGLTRLPVTLIWTESEQLGGGCRLFNGAQLHATVGRA